MRPGRIRGFGGDRCQERAKKIGGLFWRAQDLKLVPNLPKVMGEWISLPLGPKTILGIFWLPLEITTMAMGVL